MTHLTVRVTTVSPTFVKLNVKFLLGKFGKQTNKSQTCQITEAPDLLEMLDDPLLNVQDIRILSPEIVKVVYKRDASDPV